MISPRAIATSPAARRAEWLWRGSWIVGGYVAALLLGLLFARLVVRTGDWERGLDWERELMMAIHTRFPDPIDRLFLVLPWLGTNITLLPIVAIVGGWLWRVKGRADLAMHLLVVQLGSFALNPLIKDIYDRPRPQLWEMRGQFSWAAYPSGHAIASTAVLFTAAVLLWRERGWRWPFWVAGLAVLFNLYSRLYLGVHWPTDVVGGVLIGVVWLFATLMAFPPRRRSAEPTPTEARQGLPV